jgi:hypothetical protein
MTKDDRDAIKKSMSEKEQQIIDRDAEAAMQGEQGK